MTVTAGPDLAVMDPVTWTLDNGLRVVVQVDARLPLAAVNIRYEVGSRHEAEGQHGFAHLIEHLMFEGTAGRAGCHQGLLQAAGGSRINATTNQDRSNFFQTMPTNRAEAGPLELALDLEAERMARLAEALTDDKVERQRRVVASERLQTYDTPPYGRFPGLLLANAYPPGHPYQHLTIGSPADLRRARAGDLARFHRSYYGPNNAVLAIVGDVEPTAVRRLTETYFGPIPARPVPPRPVNPAPATHVDGQIGADLTVAGPAPAPKVYFAFRTAPFGSAEHDAVTLLAAVIGLGRGSLLYRRFAGSADLVASEEMASAWTFSAGSSLLVGGACGRPGVSPRHIAGRVTDALAGVGEAITDRELERAKALVITSWLRQLASLGGRADALTEYAATFGDPAFATGHLERLAAVRPDEVQAAAHQVLRPDNQLVLRFGGQEATGQEATGQERAGQEPGRQEPPC